MANDVRLEKSPRVDQAKSFLNSSDGQSFISDIIAETEKYRERIQPSLGPQEFYGLLSNLFGNIKWEKSGNTLEGEGFLKPVKPAGLRRLGSAEGEELALTVVTDRAV